MAAYHHTRDAAVLPIYEFTTQLATMQAPPLEMQQLLGAVHGNQDAMDAFAGITAGTVSPAEFFNPEHVGRIMTTKRPEPPAEMAAQQLAVCGLSTYLQIESLLQSLVAVHPLDTQGVESDAIGPGNERCPRPCGASCASRRTGRWLWW